ncbi:hypothetical protein [Sphingobium fuliginis]|uniref:Glycosyltransferase family 39 protein n=1 Tax=Sphingobium fuliginis ATCC 27551 TaxID=1208342 RepID=A0A5B8CLN8_SPHSA|nr:hypothetical protein [Sphingobium fuliginis]QDC38061.1 hypothetical protein FIL70_13315 [Sphingobium fuliginis ATCC 27551]
MFYLERQDRWLLISGTLLLLAASFVGWQRIEPLRGSWRLALGTGVTLSTLAFAGHFVVLSGYDMSRDEQMATFDAAILARGRLFAELPAFWQDHAAALNTLFMYPADHRGGWVSSYLPFNALMRAGLSVVGSPTLVGPLMILVGAVALWGCARRIWPDDHEASTVALLLYLCSGQVLVNGMTSYAMPAHLALNLIWLWLFLSRAWWADLAAIAIGFVAVGLHQPLMHPMFVAPLLFILLIERAWGRVAFYSLSYALIGVFWLWWPNMMWGLVQADPLTLKPAGVDYLTRLVQALQQSGLSGPANMEANLLRFVAWQPLLLLPLIGLAFPVFRRNRLAAGLGGGCLLTIIVMLLILPYQGHGFGYRYLHGLIGNVLLLAVFGWKEIKTDVGRWRGLLLMTSVAGLVVMLPMQLAMAHAFYRPWATVSAQIDQSSAAYVVIGDEDVPFSRDLIINPPLLDRRPVRLVREAIDSSLITHLCADRPSVGLVGDRLLAPITRYFKSDKEIGRAAAAANAEFAPLLRAAGCRVSSLG